MLIEDQDASTTTDPYGSASQSSMIQLLHKSLTPTKMAIMLMVETLTLSHFGLDSFRKNPKSLCYHEREVEDVLIAILKGTNTQVGMSLEEEIATEAAESELHTTGVDLLLEAITQITILVGAVEHLHGSCLRSIHLQEMSLRSV